MCSTHCLLCRCHHVCVQVELPKPEGSASAGKLPRSRSKGSRLGEDEGTVVVDVTRLHRWVEATMHTSWLARQPASLILLA
jgi:hypothetical protein